MPDTEQLALRFPVGTRARLRALALPGEPMTSVLIRALAALEAAPALDHGPPPGASTFAHRAPIFRPQHEENRLIFARFSP